MYPIREKKGQVVIFIIIGFMILLSFGLIIYFVGSIQQGQDTAENLIESVERELDQKTMNYVTSTCLKKIMEEGLIKIGERGGYFSPEDFNNLSFMEDLSSPNSTDDGTYYLIDIGDTYPPWYPCKYPTEDPLHCGFIYDKTLFPELNRIRYGHHNGLISSLIVKQLQAYVKDNLPQCSESGFNQSSGYNYDITATIPEVDIQLSQDSVVALAKYDIVLGGIAGVFDKKEIDAKASIPVSFGKVYPGIMEILKDDILYLDFDMIEDTRAGKFNGRDMIFASVPGDISIIKVPAPEDSSNDIFIINDSTSVIDGRSFIFKFARKNRNPVLDLIPRINSSNLQALIDRGFELTYLSSLATGEIPPEGMGRLEIDAVARDPDEDKISYIITQSTPGFKNWPSDPNIGKFSFDLEEEDVGIHEVTVVATDGNLEDFQIVRIFVERLLRVFRFNYENFLPAQTNPVVKSSFLSLEDPFYIEFTHNLMFDQHPNPKNNPSYTYSLVINGNNIKTWTLPASSAPKYISFPDLILSTTRPSLTDFSNVDIKRKYLVKASMEGTYKPFIQNPREINNISLVIQTSGLVPQNKTVQLPIEVKRCIPSYTNIYSYPYSNFEKTNNPSKPGYYNPSLSLNPFLASHDCCREDTLEDYRLDTRKDYQYCFKMEYFTSRPSPNTIYFPANLAISINPSNGDIKDYDTPSDITTSSQWGSDINDESNDIYIRSFHQSCSRESGGNIGRGNICAGDAKDEWSIYIECGDLIIPGQVARCQGPSRYPPTGYPSSNSVFLSNNQGYIPSSAADISFDSNGEPQCYNYPAGETFEKNFGYSQPLPGGQCKSGGYYCDGYGRCVLGSTT